VRWRRSPATAPRAGVTSRQQRGILRDGSYHPVDEANLLGEHTDIQAKFVIFLVISATITVGRP
jgi:hypothetical protein